MDFFKDVLKNPRYICAPMVDQSDLAFRILVRRYGAQLCYTPMFHAKLFACEEGYRKAMFSTCESDRPLVVQFCANKPETFVAAARFVEDECDAVDLNLGCPQAIAKVGHYGAFLQDEWQLVSDIVSKAKQILKVPVFCKIRIFDDVSKTIEYAKLLERSGCSLLAVHGRTREMKGRNAGSASWEQIRAVVQAVNIPVIANGNVWLLEDAANCLRETNANGVMCAEGLLRNPALFSNREHRNELDIFHEYLQLAKEHLTHIRIVRSHMFRFLNGAINGCVHLQKKLGSCASFVDMDDFLNEVKRFQRAKSKCSAEMIVRRINYQGDQERSLQRDSAARTASTTPEIPVAVSAVDVPAEHLEWTRGLVHNEVTVDRRSAEVRRECRKRRKKERYLLILAARKAKRKVKKQRHKERLRLQREQQELEGMPRVSRKKMLQLARERLEASSVSGIAVCLDLGLCDHMSSKELGKLSSQIRRLYGINRKSSIPLDLNLINFRKESLLYKDCVARNDGFENYQLFMYPDGFESVLQRRNIHRVIYLSPDAEVALEGSLDKDVAYIVGGLVDETVEKVNNELLKLFRAINIYVVKDSLVNRGRSINGFLQKLYLLQARKSLLHCTLSMLDIELNRLLP